MVDEIAGFKIITDINLTKSAIAPRTVKERWFTLPWKPWRKTKEVKVPDPDLRVIRSIKTIVGHPVAIVALKKGIALRQSMHPSCVFNGVYDFSGP